MRDLSDIETANIMAKAFEDLNQRVGDGLRGKYRGYADIPPRTTFATDEERREAQAEHMRAHCLKRRKARAQKQRVKRTSLHFQSVKTFEHIHSFSIPSSSASPINAVLNQTIYRPRASLPPSSIGSDWEDSDSGPEAPTDVSNPICDFIARYEAPKWQEYMLQSFTVTRSQALCPSANVSLQRNVPSLQALKFLFTDIRKRLYPTLEVWRDELAVAHWVAEHIDNPKDRFLAWTHKFEGRTTAIANASLLTREIRSFCGEELQNRCKTIISLLRALDVAYFDLQEATTSVSLLSKMLWVLEYS
ncbi:hypothetical protein BKA62DRAFT_673702 [Auriculariales sp. MPI-PUGE-AT-0066]|nr:hypothetical protein BKA62DRAFT_673702 [Auriculariales sp. MPI-PUGE-AT-0066]